MKRIGMTLVLCAGLALPAAAGAAEAPTSADKRNAAKECRAERTAMGQELFAQKYGRNASKRNAFGKCVSARSREEAAERRKARAAARQECRTVKGKDRAACRKESAAEHKAEADRQDRKRIAAAKTCRQERDAMGEQAFDEKYGTNKRKSNAFGKCVSATARKQEQQA